MLAEALLYAAEKGNVIAVVGFLSDTPRSPIYGVHALYAETGIKHCSECRNSRGKWITDTVLQKTFSISLENGTKSHLTICQMLMKFFEGEWLTEDMRIAFQMKTPSEPQPQVFGTCAKCKLPTLATVNAKNMAAAYCLCKQSVIMAAPA